MNNIHEDSPPSFFAMIPNIIHELGLDPYEKALYTLLKKLAGERSHITYSNQNLADMAMMSRRKLIDVKKKLSSKFEILGKPLISVTKRKTKIGDPDTSDIKLMNIWDANDKFYKEKSRGSAPHALGVVHKVHEGSAPHAHDLITIEEDKKEKREEKKFSLPFSDQDECIKKIYHSLRAKGITIPIIKHVAEFASQDKFWIPKIKSSELFIKHFDTMRGQAPKMLDEMDELEQMQHLVQTLHKEFPLTRRHLALGKNCVVDKDHKRNYEFSVGYHEIDRRLREIYH